MKRSLLSLAALAALAGPARAFVRGLTLPPMFGAEGTNNPTRYRYRKRNGYTAAQGKRQAAKRRNVLRARGHHRQAVR